jgi:hypothetical protein
MKFKKGQKVTVLVHGAGVTSKEAHVVEKVTKKEVFVDGLEEGFPLPTLRRDGVFGFWLEVKPA